MSSLIVLPVFRVTMEGNVFTISAASADEAAWLAIERMDNALPRARELIRNATIVKVEEMRFLDEWMGEK